MTSSYLNGTTIKIPETFDSKRLKATLAACIEIDQWSSITFASEHALATVLGISDSESSENISESQLEGVPKIGIPFLRLLPAKHWLKVTDHDGYEGHRNHSTAAMALVRGIRDTRSYEVTLTDALLQLTDAEVDALARALVGLSRKSKKGDALIRFRSSAFAKRLFRKTSNADAVALYRYIQLGQEVAIEALTDAQLSALHIWTNGEKDRHHDAPIFQERLRRGQVTPQTLVEHFKVAKGEFVWRDPSHLIDLTSSDAAGGDGLLRKLRVQADIVRHAATLDADLRKWFLANLPAQDHFSNRLNSNKLFFTAVFYDSSVEAWLVNAMTEDHKRRLSTSHDVKAFAQNFAHALLFHRDPDSAIKALRAIKGKTMSNLLDQVKVELTNARSMAAQNDIVIASKSANASTQSELIVWESTSTHEAQKLLEHLKSPMTAILQGIESTNPVGILGAAAAWHTLVQKQAKPDPRTREIMERIFVGIDTWFGPEAPVGAKLKKAIGITSAASLLLEIFRTTVRVVPELSLQGVAEDFLLPLSQRSTNARVKDWIIWILRECTDGLVPDAEAMPPLGERLTALTTELATHPSGLVPAVLVERGTAVPGKTSINRLYGPPIGVSDARWPRFEKKKMVHLLTLETRYFTDSIRKSYQAKGIVAVALFISDLGKHKALAPDNKHTALVPLSAGDLKLGANVVATGGETKTGLELVLHAMQVPNALFKGGVKKGALLALREIFNYRSLLHLHRKDPKWIQRPEDAPAFHFDFDEAFASELNVGDDGRMYVFRDTAFIQSA
jgi:hypothetical protein